MKNNYIIITNRGAGDRLGAQLSWYICQLIYAHYNSYYIEYNEELYPNSIFTLSLKDYINEYNINKIKGEYINIIECDDWCKLNSKIVTLIKSDLISYFKKHLFKIRYYLDNNALSRKYYIPFNPSKTILVHLRLDDTNFNNRIDYDGSLSFNYHVNKINNIDFDYSDDYQYYINNNILKDHNLYNAQGPIHDNKIESIIAKIKIKHPQHQVLIITSPIGDVTLPYNNIIRSEDPSLDLYYLCNCDIVILSRSTFALSSIYLSNTTEYWIPKWGYASSLGLETQFSNIKFNYFD